MLAVMLFYKWFIPETKRENIEDIKGYNFQDFMLLLPQIIIY